MVTPRGSNEVERLSDLLGEAAVVGDSVCVAAYQNQVSCHEVATGRAKWTQRLDVSQPVAADQTVVVGVESNSRVHAYDRVTSMRPDGLPPGRRTGRMLVTREGLLIQTQSGRLMLMTPSAAAK